MCYKKSVAASLIKYSLKAIPIIFSLILLGFISQLEAAELYFVDAHSQMDEAVNQQTIISLMDQNGVHRTILSARSDRNPGEVVAFSNAFQKRIIPSITTKKWGYVLSAEKKHKKYYEALKNQSESGKFHAIAEVLLWHDGCPKDACPSVRVAPDDNRVKAALDVALTHNWPFVVHIEFGSLSSADRQFFMTGLESLLRSHPSHPFAIIHMGQLNYDEARRLIEKYDNIYFIAAHSNPIAVESARGIKPWVNMFEEGRFATKWLKLILDHPERFVFALDNVMGDVHWKASFYNAQMAMWRQALADLPEKAAHAIAHSNAERLWKIPPKE